MNTPAILEFLGFTSGRDFWADSSAPGVYRFEWYSDQPRPTDVEIAAAELPAMQEQAKDRASAERNRRVDAVSGETTDRWRSHVRSTAAAVDLTLRVALGTASEDDDSALVALKSSLDAAEAIEASHAALLAEIDACTTVEEVEAIDVTDPTRWPA